LRVLGSFPLRDPDKVLGMLEQTLPIAVTHTLPWWITIEAREVAQ
jgi:transmembrane sensor